MFLHALVEVSEPLACNVVTYEDKNETSVELEGRGECIIHISVSGRGQPISHCP